MRSLVLVLLLLCPLTLFADSKAKFIGLRIQATPTSSHFTFILNKKTAGTVKYLPQKKQLVVEFNDARKQFNLDRVQLQHANVATIHTQTLSDGKLQILLKLKEKVKWKIAFLPENKNESVHLQLDIVTVYDYRPQHQALQNHFEKDLLTSFATTLSTNKQLIALNKRKPTKQSPLTFIPFPVAEESTKKKLFTVVIDPGHGGKDVGARGKGGTLEKNVVLAIAKRLAKEINLHSNMRAVLTRTGDYYVPLRERLNVARKEAADLFVAIHADAYFDKAATGVSIYALSQRGATSEAARWLAKQETYPELDGVELSALKDRSPVLRSVLIDLSQTATIRDSLRLGNAMLDALDDFSPLHYKHVEQAQFVVLKSPDIPSILVETAFITNPHEEKRLANAIYQQKLADAMLQGINKYLDVTQRG